MLKTPLALLAISLLCINSLLGQGGDIQIRKGMLTFAPATDRGAETPRKKRRIHRLDGSRIHHSKLDKQVQALVEKAKVTGFTLTIFNQHAVVYQKAFGYSNYDAKDYLTIDHVFYGASLSKSVFGYLVAQLAQEGIIDLDRPLQDYLDVPIPELEFEKEWRGFKELTGDGRYRKITARMCLAHTTGFPNWRWISRTGEFQPEGKLQFYFDPGTSFSYSGEGMQLLQYVLQKITGKGLEQLAREYVFDPIGMEMTSYLWQERFKDRTCNGHAKDQKVFKIDIADEAAAAGSMSTTVVDYSNFMRRILELSRSRSPITRLMFTPNIRIRSKKQFGPGALKTTGENDTVGLSYGLGWGLLNETPYGKAAFKEGHGEGFQHYSIIFPEKGMGILLMSNSDNAESIFKKVLEIGIGDIYTPWLWEDYIPYGE
ncbi:serine hydrolase domain-containing protein [Sabulibacter ruber]|uniref:serine hydrolase domain-containing protein n=1 Tax=Sabulibacter ruber TaxID=2811901 RepID=UPI001F625AA9|nr:serine hydrolase domain-containing protein [Sabulibacter ruber]